MCVWYNMWRNRNMISNPMGPALIMSHVFRHKFEVTVEQQQAEGFCFSLFLFLKALKPVGGKHWICSAVISHSDGLSHWNQTILPAD